MPSKSKFKELKGLALYNFLLKKLAEQNKKSPKKLQLSLRRRREIVSKDLYSKFKNAPTYTLSEVNLDIRKIVKGLPKEEVCNPNNLETSQLEDFEFWDLDKYILSLPDCTYVRVNAGSYGVTKIFSTRGYDYRSLGISAIVEDIRKDTVNDSGVASFKPVVKLKPKKQPNKNIGENYFIDLVLNINNQFVDSTKSEEVKEETIKVKKTKKVEELKEKVVKKIITTKSIKPKKKKAQYKKAAGLKIAAKKDKERILGEYNKQIELIAKLYKMGAINKQLYLSQNKELLNEKNERLKQLPKL